jgi:hypothetical protein
MDAESSKRFTRLAWVVCALAALLLGAIAWADDAITLEGHWTVYTARCDGGQWERDTDHCSGRRLAAERHRFLSDRSASTVQFEIVGTATTQGTLAGCTVQDGRNWMCLSCGLSVCPVTRVLQRGEPKLEASAAASVRPVSKLTWHWLRLTRGGG